ncbi:hypothetical protein BGZ80_002261 [Entomortierella chlamydospora]|uniref:Uncharacterized protein n=1 Tax=Entomortierella chlamydospora TaxID=101097 RepID=A0A9P6MQ34_9FUNG|nr:hypothetical protein BGZ79_000674 [Entomortierella chlamydospora]KAG0009573.1 hypothetical protein BGZ80_002261 [Entomortierella chlamydospora]
MSLNHLSGSNVSMATLLLASIQELDASSRQKMSSCICGIPGLFGGDCSGGARKKKPEACDISELPTSHSSRELQSARQKQLCDDHHDSPDSEVQNETETSSRSFEMDVGSSSVAIDSSENPTLTEEDEGEKGEEGEGDDSEGEDGEEEDGDDEFLGMSKAQIIRRMKLEIEHRKFLEKERRERSRTILRPAGYLWTTSPRNEHDNRPSLSTYETMVVMNAATALHMKGRPTVTLDTADQTNGYIENDFSHTSCSYGMDRGQPTTTTLFPHIPLRPLPPTPCGYLRNKLSSTFFPARSRSDSQSDGGGPSHSSSASL